ILAPQINISSSNWARPIFGPYLRKEKSGLNRDPLFLFLSVSLQGSTSISLCSYVTSQGLFSAQISHVPVPSVPFAELNLSVL
ncbi:hypothetical protein EUTSA_v10019563mg, partial [Eutrema salsugineum]